MPLWGPSTNYVTLCVCVIHSCAGGQACVHKQHTQICTKAGKEAHKHTRKCQGKSVEVGSSSCCIILFGMLFLFPGSKLQLHRPRLSSITHTHTHARAGMLHSFLSQNHFRENSLWQMPQTKRETGGQKNPQKHLSLAKKKRHFLTHPARALKSRSSFYWQSRQWSQEMLVTHRGKQLVCFCVGLIPFSNCEVCPRGVDVEELETECAERRIRQRCWVRCMLVL